MSVVDHRATFVAHGRRGSSQRVGSARRFTSPSISMAMFMTTESTENDVLSASMPGRRRCNGAFHSHYSSRNLEVGNNVSDDGKRYRGLNTEAARELSESRRNLNGTACSYSGIFDEDLGTISNSDSGRRRMVKMGGVSYGAASVRRLNLDPDQNLESGETAVITVDPAASIDRIRGVSRRRSISAGEGAWLVKHSSRRRKSSKSSIATYDKKDSEAIIPIIIPDIEQPAPEKPKSVEFSSSTPKTDGILVQFSTVSIRYHSIILGNNPFCTSGPPLELAWEHEPGATQNNIPIDMYEAARSPHRMSEWDLALSRGERESRLLESGCTREEIAAAVRETSRIKAQRASTVLNLKMAGIEEFSDGLRRRGAKMVGLRKSSDWMYQDWKKKNQCGRSLFSDTRADIVFQQEQGKRPLSNSARDETNGTTPLMQRMKLRKNAGSPPLTTEEQRPESPKRVYDGPAFGITRTSLSTRFGNDSDHSVNGGGVWPFAIIKVVYANSPSSEAGLHRGDRIIKLGSITALNHDHCRAIPELGQVAATKESSIQMVVENGHGERRNVTIRPHKWNGRGYFGFLFRELGSEMEE